MEPYLKRWSPYVLKLAMLFRPFEDPLSHELSDSSIESAMSYLLPAIKSTAYLFEGELGESEHQRKCRKVYEWICMRMQTRGTPVKWSEIMCSKTLEGGATEYEYVCKTLVESGRVVADIRVPKKDSLYAINTQQG